MISGGRQLQGHNQVELVVVGMSFFYFFFIWVCLGLRCKSCDVGCLELFGFEEDECVVICDADVDGHTMLTTECLGFFSFFIWVFLRCDVG